MPEDNRENPGWKRNNTFKYVDAECKHVMENAGILDLSRFAKTRITGPGAEAWLNRMTCQKVPTAKTAASPCPPCWTTTATSSRT
jgi:dimethylglycine dehydrogenase